MGPTKTLGIDGFQTIFYQKCCHILGKDVSSFCLKILNNGLHFDRLNNTNIMLIPKVLNPSKMVNFHPINLCNALYKVIAKIISKGCLRSVLINPKMLLFQEG